MTLSWEPTTHLSPQRCTPVNGWLICFTWLQKGLLKPLLKISLRVHPRASIYWHNNSIKQHHALTVKPPRADAFNLGPTQWSEARHWRTLLNCCKVVKLTAAMVAASHSSFTHAVKKEELAQTEHEHFKLLCERVQCEPFLSELSRRLVCSCQSLLRRGHWIRTALIQLLVYNKIYINTTGGSVTSICWRWRVVSLLISGADILLHKSLSYTIKQHKTTTPP